MSGREGPRCRSAWEGVPGAVPAAAGKTQVRPQQVGARQRIPWRHMHALLCPGAAVHLLLAGDVLGCHGKVRPTGSARWHSCDGVGSLLARARDVVSTSHCGIAWTCRSSRSPALQGPKARVRPRGTAGCPSALVSGCPQGNLGGEAPASRTRCRRVRSDRLRAFWQQVHVQGSPCGSCAACQAGACAGRSRTVATIRMLLGPPSAAQRCAGPQLGRGTRLLNLKNACGCLSAEQRSHHAATVVARHATTTACAIEKRRSHRGHRCSSVALPRVETRRDETENRIQDARWLAFVLRAGLRIPSKRTMPDAEVAELVEACEMVQLAHSAGENRVQVRRARARPRERLSSEFPATADPEAVPASAQDFLRSWPIARVGGVLEGLRDDDIREGEMETGEPGAGRPRVRGDPRRGDRIFVFTP